MAHYLADSQNLDKNAAHEMAREYIAKQLAWRTLKI